MTTGFVGSIAKPPQLRARYTREVTTGKSSGARLVYPDDLGAHLMLFTFHDYKFTRKSQPRKVQSAAIALPPPQSLIEKHNIDYNNSELGVIGGQLLDLVNPDAMRGALAGRVEGFSGQQLGAAYPNLGAYLNSVLTSAQGKFGDMQQMTTIDKAATATAVMRQGTGAMAAGLNLAFNNAPNPHITAVFRNVQLNSHTFDWQLSPRSESESATLMNIIQEFKRSALPGYAGAGGDFANSLLSFPRVASIIFMGQSNQLYLYGFKDCVIKGIQANYAPNGPSFFAGTGAPTHINLQIAVQEIQIHTREDYPDTPIAASIDPGFGMMGVPPESQIDTFGLQGAVAAAGEARISVPGGGIGHNINIPESLGTGGVE